MYEVLGHDGSSACMVCCQHAACMHGKARCVAGRQAKAGRYKRHERQRHAGTTKRSGWEIAQV